MDESHEMQGDGNCLSLVLDIFASLLREDSEARKMLVAQYLLGKLELRLVDSMGNELRHAVPVFSRKEKLE